MQFIPIKTRVLNPPKDNLYAVLDAYLKDVCEGDIILVSSKVVAIHEGRCVPKADATKAELAAATADVLIARPYWNSPLTIVHNTFLGAAGIDERAGRQRSAIAPAVRTSAHRGPRRKQRRQRRAREYEPHEPPTARYRPARSHGARATTLRVHQPPALVLDAAS